MGFVFIERGLAISVESGVVLFNWYMALKGGAICVRQWLGLNHRFEIDPLFVQFIWWTLSKEYILFDPLSSRYDHNHTHILRIVFSGG